MGNIVSIVVMTNLSPCVFPTYNFYCYFFSPCETFLNAKKVKILTKDEIIHYYNSLAQAVHLSLVF